MPIRSHRSRPARGVVAAAAVAALALVGAACGDDDEDAGTTATTTAPADDATTTTADGDATTTTADGDAAGGGAVELVDTSLGSVLASDGRTLYVFTPDDGGAPTCYDDCAATWPPLLADGDVTVGEGLDGALFATVARDDGTQQVTVDGWPLYFYAADAAPGDVNGQGVGDRWFVVDADGAAVQAAEASTGGY